MVLGHQDITGDIDCVMLNDALIYEAHRYTSLIET